MGQITIYPDEKLEKIIVEEAEKQKRSLNNYILFLLTEIFKKKIEESKSE